MILAACGVAAYSRTFSVPLILDDSGTILGNPSIRHWSTALSPPITTTAGGRPVLNLSLAINYAIGGTQWWGYHVANLAIHVAAALSLLGIVRRTLARQAVPGAALIAFSSALLWMMHPLQTESVTYIVQRAESLMGLFYLLTLYCFIRGAEADHGRDPLWFALTVAACLLGMATKEVMVSAPLIVLLYDRTFLAGGFREALARRRILYLGMAATWGELAALVAATHGRAGAAGFGSGVAFWTYLQSQFPAIVRYVKLSVWPHPLVFDYGTQWSPGFWAMLPSAIAVAGLVAATIWALLRPGLKARSLGFAGAWFFAILAPTSLVPGNRQTMAEHRMYLALIPIVVLATVAIFRRLRRAALPACLTLAALLAGLTVRRNLDYRSALNLWTVTVADCPGNAFARNSLAYELEHTPGSLNEAIAQYQAALRLKPDYADAHFNLANALNAAGWTGEAIAEFRAALQLTPNRAEAHNNLGTDLFAEQRFREATEEFETAVRLQPNYPAAQNNLGNALCAQSRPLEAIPHFETALRLQPDNPATHYNLGNALAAAGRPAEAVAEFGAAVELAPDDAASHFGLAVALLDSSGSVDQAAAHLETALKLNPGFEPARRILARIRTMPP